MRATAYNYRASATVRTWNQLRSIVERAPDDFGTQPERYRYAFTSSHYHGAFAPATPTPGAHGARCHARVTMAHLARQEASRCFAKTT